MEFSDVENIAPEPRLNVKVSFIQTEAISSVKGMNIFNLDFRSSFHSSAIEVKVILPKVVASWKKLWLSIVALLKRKRRVIYDIKPFGTLPTIDLEKGEITYQLRQVFPGSGIIYRSVGSIDVIALILGAIFALVSKLVLDLLIEWLRTLQK